MNRSETIKELATALSKAQAAMKGAAKDSENPHFRSKYADLSSVWEACREALTANGLSVVQAPRAIEAGIEVETMLMHTSGEWISETLALPVQKADAQGFGSALTYCRRYGLSAMVGIAPEDDDGNAAAGAKPREGEFRPQKPARADARNLLTQGTQQLIDRLAGGIVDAFLSQQTELAYTKYIDAKEQLKDNTDAQVAMWDLLDSGQRSTLKRLHKEAQTHPATQA
jgi:hypothetical protein